MKEFAEFAAGIGLGLAKAVREDENVFLLAVTGLLFGSRSKRLNGIGKAMGMYVVARRADQYVGVMDRKLSQIALIMHESNQQPPPEPDDEQTN